jgi:isopenicillin N synthase-like dioxygenase
MQRIPLLDLSTFYQVKRSPQELKQLLCQVDETLCEIGFLCIKGTQLSSHEIQLAQSVGMRFFDLPLTEKNQVKALTHANRGYTGLAELGLSYSMDASDLKQDRQAPSDLFERYRIGPTESFTPELMERYGHNAFAPNIWPAQIAEFAPVMKTYYRQMNQLAQDLLALFALSLGLDEQWFQDKVDHSMSSLALNHYPAQTVPPLAGQLRAGPHTDYGTVTIVAPTAAPGGLQVRTKDGQWQDVSVEPGTFVVNIGDLMAQWTNDRWVSTVHRVANPSAEQAMGSRRLSLVFFHQPNPDAVIDCIPTCVDSIAGKKYQPVSAGEYINAKISRHFKSYLAA